MKKSLCFFVCALTLFALVPASAFDEDHKEVINGAMLHFRVRGADRANPYIVLLHGGPGFSSHMFYTWGTRLEKSLNVVYLDQRGCGESARLTVADPTAPKPSEIKGYTLATLVEDIEGVRRALRVDKWYVLGHSYGGLLGVEYVAAHPEHVLGYVHMDGLVSVPRMQADILDDAAKKITTDAAIAPTVRALLGDQIKTLRALPPDDPQRLFGALGLATGPGGLYFAGDQAAAFPAFLQQIGASVQPYHVPYAALAPAPEPTAALIANDHFLTRDDTPLLARITVPTLILNGKQDGVITPRSAEAVHGLVKGSSLIEFDACGHFPFLEQPDKAAAAVLAFTVPKKASVPGSPVAGGDRFVRVVFMVAEEGQVTQTHVLHSSGDKAVHAAYLDAVGQLHLRPAMSDGKPRRARVEHTFIITRKSQSP